jgi:hypothetical protein
MNENAAPLSRFSAWLPVASLALSAAAFALGAPARLARVLHRRPAAGVQAEKTMRDEPDLFPMPSQAALVPARFVLGRELAALR